MGGMAQLELDEVHANAVDYQHFLLDSPTPYHAAEVVAQRLVDAGFTRVDEKGAWDASHAPFSSTRVNPASTRR